MSNNINPNANEGEGNTGGEYVEHHPEPITPENDADEFENINNATDKGQSTNNPQLLKVADEFVNGKTNLLVKYFHANIKRNITNPEKHYRVLENVDINDKEQKCIWSNDPTEIGKIFVEFDTLRKFNLKSVSPEQVAEDNKKNALPRPIKPYDAYATDYKTDEDGTQHFPTECLKFNNRNYWMSDAPVDTLESQVRLISFRFRTSQPIKYFCVNFHDPEHLTQVFDLIYETDQYDAVTGNPKGVLAFANIESLKVDGLQIIEFEQPILTKGLSMRFSSNVAAINYAFVLDKELTDQQLNMFLNINSNSDIDNKAFNNPNPNQ